MSEVRDVLLSIAYAAGLLWLIVATVRRPSLYVPRWATLLAYVGFVALLLAASLVLGMPDGVSFVLFLGGSGAFAYWFVRLAPWACRSCGARNAPRAELCSGCGITREESDELEAQEADAEVIPPDTYLLPVPDPQHNDLAEQFIHALDHRLRQIHPAGLDRTRTEVTSRRGALTVRLVHHFSPPITIALWEDDAIVECGPMVRTFSLDSYPGPEGWVPEVVALVEELIQREWVRQEA